MAWIDFKQVAGAIPFKTLLDHLGIVYEETEKEIKTEKLIINKEKNLFFFKGTKNGGNVINFYSSQFDCSLRDAALYLHKTFIEKPKDRERSLPDYQLRYHPLLNDFGISEELAKEYEVGYVSKGIMAGKIGIKVYQGGEYVGFVGKEITKQGYFYPKNFLAGDYIYNLDRVPPAFAILVSSPLEALTAIAKGFPLTVGLFTKTATDKQLHILKQYEHIAIFHETGENIAARLAQQCFVKLVKRPIYSMVKEQIEDCL